MQETLVDCINKNAEALFIWSSLNILFVLHKTQSPKQTKTQKQPPKNPTKGENPSNLEQKCPKQTAALRVSPIGVHGASGGMARNLGWKKALNTSAPAWAPPVASQRCWRTEHTRCGNICDVSASNTHNLGCFGVR